MQADYVIVGAGSAGCVLAARLSEDPNISVILIEAGGHDARLSVQVPGGFIRTMVNPKINSVCVERRLTKTIKYTLIGDL